MCESPSVLCVCVLTDASSEHLSAVDQTDTDDTSRSVGSARAGSRSLPSQLAAVVGGLSPMIIMNNVVLKQVNNKSSSFCFLFLFYTNATLIFAFTLFTIMFSVYMTNNDNSYHLTTH